MLGFVCCSGVYCPALAFDELEFREIVCVTIWWDGFLGFVSETDSITELLTKSSGMKSESVASGEFE
jgi:hypothetical protein